MRSTEFDAEGSSEEQQQQQEHIDNNDEEEEEELLSFSQQLHAKCATLCDASPGVTLEMRWNVANELHPHLTATDAYFTQTGPAQGHLPVLEDWNTRFRKAYCLLLWVRPRVLLEQQQEQQQEGESGSNNNNNDNIDDDDDGSTGPDEIQRIMYRFSTAAEDGDGVGVCVTCSPWKIVDDEYSTTSSTGKIPVDHNDNASTNPKQKQQQQSSSSSFKVQTILTAYSLPSVSASAAATAAATKKNNNSNNKSTSPPVNMNYSSLVQCPLQLTNNQWHLLGFSHTFPYLKRPMWSVMVDGECVGSGELAYPVIPEKVNRRRVLLTPTAQQQPQMEFNTVLSNVVVGGVWHRGDGPPGGGSGTTTTSSIQQKEASVHEREEGQQQLVEEPDDSRKTASQLQQTSSHVLHSMMVLPLVLDIASLALYSDAISPSVQAVVAEAGPAMSLQKPGRILPTLPPVPNWAKGSSLDGPKVGIPLTVHAVALELQQQSAAKLVFGVGAVSARVLGVVGQQQRIVCPVQVQAGSTEQTPRVGLVQPAQAVRWNEEDLPSLYMAGECSMFHAVSNYLLHSPDAAILDGSDLERVTKNWSVALQEQQMLTVLVLPFFLALCPPGKVFDKQHALYQSSIRQLYALYSDHGAYGAKLIQMLADYLQHGGGRVHEEALQSGTLHIVASCLRLSLVRAVKAKLFSSPVSSADELVKRFKEQQRLKDEVFTTAQTKQDGTAPSFVPVPIVHACANLVAACCGPAATNMDELSPSMQVRRMSDVALTAVFGLALDFDLWGGDAAASARIFATVAARYGGVCLTSGYIFRNQVSVQYFLDCIRLRFDLASPSMAMQDSAHSLSLLLQAMLLSSLSNRRSISQGEHDVAACMGALSDSPLGTVAAHVILNAIVAVLTWCEVLPMEAAACDLATGTDEDHKMQVSSRLGRNLLMAGFHDVVAPMILSRTVFSGERTLARPTKSNKANAGDNDDSLRDGRGALSWQGHWRLSLSLFSWVASIAGPEGLISAKSSGSLMLASGLAGSLKGAMEGSQKVLISSLFLPPPSMALMFATTLRNEWSYTDLLSDRLQIMMPMVPGMVVSLLAHPSDSSPDTTVSTKALTALSDMLTAVGVGFHRVFGGLVHSTDGGRRNSKKLRVEASESVKAAKTHVPYLLIVAMILENHMALRSSATTSNAAVKVLRPQTSNEALRRTDLDSWIDVSSESVISEVAIDVPSNIEETGGPALVSLLRSCQKSVINTASGLIANAMNRGGSGATLSLWQSILPTLQESLAYSIVVPVAANSSSSQHGNDKPERIVDSTVNGTIAQNVLCRLIAVVLVKALKRDYQWEVWSSELSSAAAKLCQLIEEKELLWFPLGGIMPNLDRRRAYSEDQIILLCTLLDVLEYGRDATGWCQLALPTMSTTMNDSKDGGTDLSAASKLLLPALLPCFRIVISCVDKVTSDLSIAVPSDRSSTKTQDAANEACDESSLIGRIISELDFSLTAAIVGLSFSSARDTALHALASLRRAIQLHKNYNDESATALCSSLFCKVTGELRERYKGERRLRETALFDAYEDDAQEAVKQAAEESQAVERLILGGDSLLVDYPSKGVTTGEGRSLETQTSKGSSTGLSEDFVVSLEPPSALDTSATRLGFVHYEGLGAALEECNVLKKSNEVESESFHTELKKAVGILTKYLDAWDVTAAHDAAESELVKMFEIGTNMFGDGATMNKGDSQMHSQLLPLLGSETAAEAMSTFFEFAAAEKSRLKELSIRFLPSHRYSRMSYSDRFCWARYAEIGPEPTEWERGVPDGNRDIRSRLVTLPCNPQFRRYIPKYLDHSADQHETETPMMEPAEVAEESDNRRKSIMDAPSDLDAFTRNLLKAVNLEIIDITKKRVVDDEPDVTLQPLKSGSLDDDDDEFFNTVPTAEDDDDPTSLRPTTEEAKEPAAKLEKDAQSDKAEDTDDSSHGDDPSPAAHEREGKMSHYSISSSPFSTPPDNASSSLSLMHSAAAGFIEIHMDNCLHVKAEGNRPCTILLTASHLILEYEGEPEGFFEGELLAVQEEAERQKMIDEAGGGTRGDESDDLFQQRIERRQREIAALRPKSTRYNLTEVSHVYLRRYRLRDSSLEIFFIPSGGTSFGGYGLFAPSSSLFLDFGSGREGLVRRDDAAFAIMKRSPPQALKQWPDRSSQFLHDQLSRLTMGWVEGRITNFDYLLHLNVLAGRSYNDICQYPVFPWVLSNYHSDEVPDLTDRQNFRDLSKPVGALNPNRLEEFKERFNTFADPSIPPFMYGSHYSTSAGVVLHFLVRMHPFAGLHRQLQSGHFDVADRLFSSVPRTWSMCTGSSAAEVKEITPEWYCNPSFLRNENNFKLGTSQDGEVLGDVMLPPWAKGNPDKFVEVMRASLESDICSEMLPDWIDLIFGRKQQGPEAIKANNVFFYLTYYGSVDVASIEDEALRQATELQIAHFGQCPMQLFKRQHVPRLPRDLYRLSFYQLLSPYLHKTQIKKSEDIPDQQTALKLKEGVVFGEPPYLPFFSAPLSHWVHLDAPPPGPHAPLVAVRLAGIDRILAVDAKGIFHCFRWAWRADETGEEQEVQSDSLFDAGCFIAQRELPRFRSVPRLIHAPNDSDEIPAVAISKTLFSGRSVLLVLSAGDARGSLGMQLVDPAKGSIRGEVLIPSVHSARITCIATDPIGTAAGHGGVGGELALVGSADGNASLWRFMSSHYLPLRPRVRVSGHLGAKVRAVGLCSTLNVAITVSARRCCIHSIGNGTLTRTFGPPTDVLGSDKVEFADTPALAVSVQGYVVTVCEYKGGPDSFASIHLFTIEGVSLGSKALEKWRGLPHKMICTPDGTAVMVCCGRGITIHRLSACQPLEVLDEWQITETEHLALAGSVPAAYDLDLGPSLNRPVVAAAVCSSGVLRLHALSGISAWSERHKKSGLSQTVGSALAKPAQRLNKAVRDGLGLGSRLASIGRDIGKEVTSDVKDKGVGGFFGSVMFGRNKNK